MADFLTMECGMSVKQKMMKSLEFATSFNLRPIFFFFDQKQVNDQGHASTSYTGNAHQHHGNGSSFHTSEKQ